jgi:hypothetical protein
MRDNNESILRAGLLLRRLGELAGQAEQNRSELQNIRQQAQAVHEKWQALMQEMNDKAQGGSIRKDDPSNCAS